MKHFPLLPLLLFTAPLVAQPYVAPVLEQETSVEFQNWRDDARARTLPVKLFYPAKLAGPKPVILWSHGLGSSRDGADFLGNKLAEHGYISIHVQHPGSDILVWQGKDLGNVRAALQEGATLENFVLRVRDIEFVLNELTRLNEAKGPLRGQLDLERIGISGHSFGSITAQAMIGQTYRSPEGELTSFADGRIKAAVLMSPVPPFKDQDGSGSFKGVTVPCLHLTGSKDSSPFDDFPPTKRRVPFEQMRGADQYLLTFAAGNHMAFVDHRPFVQPASPRFHPVTAELSLAFWDAYLKGVPEAKAWLSGKKPSDGMIAGDKWEARLK